jgi:exosortase
MLRGRFGRGSVSAAQQEPILSLPPRLVFCFLAATSLAIWWRPLGLTFSLALQDEQFTHILLILPISVALIFLDWIPGTISAGPALKFVPPLVIAIMLNGTASLRMFRVPPDIQLSIEMLAFVVWAIASFGFSFGISALRRALFPLLFLIWIIPLPDFAVNGIVEFLQRGSAAAAHLLFAAARVPVEQRGLFLRIPGFILEVAPECSSIRSSMILIVTTMVLAYLLLRSRWKRVLLVAVAIPLSVAKNGLRIFVLGYLAIRVDRGFLTGKLHRDGGVIYLLIALAVIVALLWILRSGERRRIAIERRISV